MRALLAIVLIADSAAVLAANTFGGDFAHTVARILFVVLCLLGMKTSTLREMLLFLASLMLAAILWQDPEDHAALFIAMDLAAYFAAFIALLTALKLAAENSQSVLAVGRYLTRQPTGRRFVATATGGHILGVFLNFAAVSLMAPLIQSTTRRSDGSIDHDLERRQMSALLRGFAWILLWAPTTLGQAVLLTLFTDIDHIKIICVGIATSMLMMGIGLAYDRFEWRNSTPPGTEDAPPAWPGTALVRLGCVCATLIGATAVLQITMGFSTALSLMFVAPLVTFIWFTWQKPKGLPLSNQMTLFWQALKTDAAGLTRSAIALGLSGFIGRAVAEVLPLAQMSQHIDLGAIPGWLFLAILPILITLGGQIALSPIILVVFIGQVVQTFPALPADPTHIVFALSAGWAISMFASPNATATLLIAAASKIPPTTLTWRWNLRYGAICYAVLVGIFALLEAA
ncbi:hypothetical protein [Yoonia sp. I 8.24]|uniref:hypothetical protein n=1 Tax=Yoonia sp. I 8.24 TaxID=1537229 RepID=UPI001EDECEF5|nr:hypothetical protein [Yoonia sp. I 8.24]MCG3268101.1 hypothetical protein [Yoonia sp. I 8.24]